MRKFLLTLVTISLATLPSLRTLAAEPATTSEPTTAFIATSTTPETKPAVAENAVSPASVLPATADQKIKVGFVDMTKIASDSSPGKAAYAEVKAKTEKYQKQIKAKEKQLQKQKAAIEAQMPSLTPSQRSTKANEFQKKLESFQKFLVKAEKDVRTREAELLKELYLSVEKAAGDYGKANGYAAITMQKDLLFIGSTVDSQDLTAEIIKQLDAKQGSK
jgi:outer membrane protein